MNEGFLDWKISEFARRNPLKTAIIAEERRVSYIDLEKKTNQIANFMHGRIEKTPHVVILLDRSPELIEAIIGLLKCGLVFIPLNTSFPENRVKQMIEEIRAEWIITDAEGLKKYKNIINNKEKSSGSHHLKTFLMSEKEDGVEADEKEDIFYLAPSIESDKLVFERVFNKNCYIYFTSGSTGTPKGVLGRQKGLAHFIQWEINEFGINEHFNISQLTPPSFDPYLRDIFVPLMAGGTSCIPSNNILLNILELIRWIDANQVTLIHTVPSLFKNLVSEIEDSNCFNSLKYILLAGELLRGRDISKFIEIFNDRIKLVNVYGPTETTLAKLFYRIQPGDVNRTIIPVGQPIDRAQVLILDSKKRKCPMGKKGEIYIRTPFISAGYYNEPMLNERVFVKNPYGKHPNDIIYKTGDLGRLLPDGNIELSGRVDFQVKISGVRIELGEIENRLLKHNDVREAVVTAKEDENGDKYLCAYVVPMTGKTLETSNLKEYLSKELPHYMMPSYFVFLGKLPLTSSGKIDRTRLPDAKTSCLNMGTSYLAPGDLLEKKIASIWQEVLKLKKVGVNNNFFDLGGNSLKMMEAHSRLSKEFKKEIPVAKLFEYSTVHSLANYLKKVVRAEDTGKLIKPNGDFQHKIKKDGDVDNKIKEIAVIGMSCRFPGAKNIEEFWQNLKEGKETIGFFSDEEIFSSKVDSEFLNNPHYVKVASVLEDKDLFDASFFGYTPKEAELLDPQIRLFHECTWEALEDSGIVPERYDGLIGVYAGAVQNLEWEIRALLSGKSRSFGEFAASKLTGIRYLCTRLSYNLDLKGPSVAIQTACSTSLVAVHMACRALLGGECDVAIAGGVTVSAEEKWGYLYEENMIHAPDGHCRSFDAKGNGTVFGEGIGVTILKPLGKAIADSDHIYAVIKGTAINNDGNRKVGFTAPSVSGQVEVIRAALQIADVEPESITYIETHGTATTLGDPIEIEALNQVFNTDKKKICKIGSVKSNFGHLDSAAGIAGFTKTVLSLKHRQIPPSLFFEFPNPAIDFDNSPFEVNTRLMEWKNGKYPLRAGVTSLGMGGTNAHVILEEAPKRDESSESRNVHILLQSAKSKIALNMMSKNLADFLRKNDHIKLVDVAYTLQTGRKRFNHRRMFTCSNIDDAVEKLSISDNDVPISDVFSNNENPAIVFMFPGQGSQYINMGLDLYRTEATFKKEMDRCFEILKPLMGYDVKEILYPVKTTKEYGQAEHTADDASSSRFHLIDQTEITQPALFIFEYALAKFLMKLGLKPDTMIGHSIGEYVAACLSEVFSLENALKLVVLRGKLMQEMPPGAMLSIPLPEMELIPLLDNEMTLAAVNTSSLCVVSGEKVTIATFAKKLKENGHEGKLLHTSHAFHSKMMDPILKEFENEVSRVTINKPIIPYISNLTGQWIGGDEMAKPTYWSQHLRNTIRFADGLKELLKKTNSIFVEVGPGRSLCTFVRQHVDKKPSQKVINLIRHPGEKMTDEYYLLNKIGQLWLYGKDIDWSEFYRGEKRYRLSLPTYPFERQRYWINGPSYQIHKETSTMFTGTFPIIQKDNFESSQENDIHTRPNLLKPYVAPRNQIEITISDIWRKLFGFEKIGIHDDFLELRGDSLTAITVIHRIQEKLGVEVPLIEFFNNPTIENITKYIKDAEKKKFFSIKSLEKKDYYPLSSAQKRMYITHQMDVDSVSYNITQAVVLLGNLDRKRFEEAIRKLIMAHESFLTSFRMLEDKPIQRIHSDIAQGFKLQYLESTGKEAEPIIKNFRKPYNLSKAPLLRVGLIKTSEAKHLLILDMNHIISDGFSQSILVEDFITLYQGRKLSPLKLQYKDFSEWQRKHLHTNQFKKQEEYWLSRFKGKIPVLELPTDYQRPPAQSFEGHTIRGRIEKALTGKIEFIAAEYGATLYMVLLASFTLLLSIYTNQNDIIIGTPVAGRRHADLDFIVGMFVNVLLMRNSVERKKNFHEFLKDVKNNTIEAFDNQDYPFDYFVERLGLKRETGRNPLYEVIFALQNLGIQEFKIPGLQIRPFEYINNNVKTDLRLGVEEKNGELEMTLTYSTDLYKQETARDMLRHYEEILEQVVTDKMIKIEDIKISNNLATLSSRAFKEDSSEFNF